MLIETHEIIGMAGSFVIIVSYFFLQAGRISFNDWSYLGLNALGALCIIFSLWFEFNLSAFFIEFFWLVISLYGAARKLVST